MNIVLIRPDEMSSDSSLVLLASKDPRSDHVRRVLRLKPGDTLRAGVVGGPIGAARLVAVDEERMTLEFSPRCDPDRLPPIELILGHPRPIVLQRLLRDLSSIGPARVVVVPTELGERSYTDATMWRRVYDLLVDGASQGGTTLLPQVARARSLGEAVRDARGGEASRIVLHPAEPDGCGTVVSLADALDERVRAPLTIAIGSERGWTAGEIDVLRDSGFQPASLGERILRTEVAASIAVWSAVAWYNRR